MMALWQRFSARDQISLLLLAGVLVIYLAYMLVWSPLATLRDDMARRNVATSESLQRVDAMVSEIMTLRDSGAGNKNRRNLTSLINQSTSRLGLPVSRLQPNSRGEIQVRMEDAAFDDLLAFLHELEYREGLLVLEASVAQAGSTGRVNATVRVGQGS
ncbi:MAG: type II secretion system protein M [Halieaceae bacterium]